MQSYTLSKKETNASLDVIRANWSPIPGLDRIKNLRIAVIDDQRALLISEQFAAIRYDNIVLPYLGSEDLLRYFPRVIVDAGAIRFVCNGADVMRPGIVKWEGDIAKDRIVVVAEQTHSKNIVVGISVVDVTELSIMKKGVVIKTLHYVGDKFWEAYKTIETGPSQSVN